MVGIAGRKQPCYCKPPSPSIFPGEQDVLKECRYQSSECSTNTLT